jgi:cytochrome c biogenesis protein ResB
MSATARSHGSESTGARRVLEALGSLKMAIAVLVTLGVVCAAATFYESAHGTPTVQRDVYRTAWFAGLLGLLAVNIAVSMMLRFPWKRHQTGFVLAHVGVLLILAGSLVSLQFGLDATLALYEGESSRQLETSADAPSSEGVPLPFQVTLLEFRSEHYPGSRMPATYESLVRVDDAERGSSEYLIGMNRPLHYRGYVFFQSSFVEGQPMMSILSVAQAPGLAVVYLGTALLCLGVVWMFYVNPALARHRAARALRAREVSHVPVDRALGVAPPVAVR